MHCPTDDELRRYAQDAETNAGLDEHVRQCATCQRRLESLTGDSEVLAELRSAWTDKLNEAAERRIAEICRDVSEKLPQPAKNPAESRPE